jgi:hypothetical protein
MARPKTAPAEAPPVAELVHTLSFEATMCRSLGHAWNVVPQGARRRTDLAQRGQSELTLECGRCLRRRGDLLDGDHEVIGHTSGNKYPDGYLLPKGSGRMPRSVARGEMIHRLGQLKRQRRR